MHDENRGYLSVLECGGYLNHRTYTGGLLHWPREG